MIIAFYQRIALTTVKKSKLNVNYGILNEFKSHVWFLVEFLPLLCFGCSESELPRDLLRKDWLLQR